MTNLVAAAATSYIKKSWELVVDKLLPIKNPVDVPPAFWFNQSEVWLAPWILIFPADAFTIPLNVAAPVDAMVSLSVLFVLIENRWFVLVPT